MNPLIVAGLAIGLLLAVIGACVLLDALARRRALLRNKRSRPLVENPARRTRS